ncbi:putative transcription initiation factor TFIID subunit 8 [Apostichopus japonicus]|uniref:Transcription initiation factor TFIID subunit 8 n=1 Tax=Stichopus japonicus TaxID=307972 RepID=A0A2G8K1H9_STIJA|nr:putative transcription initiation factor TFIID subunit 8 [Apostichopus japonicus]
MTSTASSKHAAAHRRALSVAVAALCRDAGFDSSTESCIETLTEIVQSYIIEFGRSSKSFSELTGRTMPMVTDVAMAVSQMGSDISNLREYQRKLSRVKIPKQEMMYPTGTPATLETGQRKKHPSYVPDYLPVFPDPHTYIKTATFKKLENTYKVVRTNAATQQRSVERALTNFIAKTTDSQTLFPGDSNLFPLIACTPSARPYSDALLPIDHDVAKESSQVNRDPVEQHPSSHDSGDRSGIGQNEDDAKNADLSSSGETPDKNKRKVDAVDVSSNPYMMKVRKPKLKKKR